MAEEKRENQGITKITVSGFKSLRGESSIEVRPLTILAGANSSGKSSIMQPLLLMKQTLEADYDPGTFLLNGPNVYFTDASQFIHTKKDEASFNVSIELNNQETLLIVYEKFVEYPNLSLLPIAQLYKNYETHLLLTLNHTNDHIIEELGENIEPLRVTIQALSDKEVKWRVIRNRCFLSIGLHSNGENVLEFSDISLKVLPLGDFKTPIRYMIHVPGLRGNPRREYPLTSSEGPQFEGTFDNYTATLIYAWQVNRNNHLAQLQKMLKTLDLTSQIAAKPLNDAQIEIRVGRTRENNLDDTVSIADVGFGVSQVLPVLVALLVAESGQLVYIEQPELHLHPRAQAALAQVLADAANRGVRVVVETHSALLINGIQTLIAQEKITHDKVTLHWFKRGDDGNTTIDSQEPDKYGAYGDWPEDFAEVQLEADSAYLDAVEKREFEDWNGNQKSEMPGD
jgi:predicted ATPase